MTDPQREYAAVLEAINALYSAHPEQLFSNEEAEELSRLIDRAGELDTQIAVIRRWKGDAA